MILAIFGSGTLRGRNQPDVAFLLRWLTCHVVNWSNLRMDNGRCGYVPNATSSGTISTRNRPEGNNMLGKFYRSRVANFAIRYGGGRGKFYRVSIVLRIKEGCSKYSSSLRQELFTFCELQFSTASNHTGNPLLKVNA